MLFCRKDETLATTLTWRLRVALLAIAGLHLAPQFRRQRAAIPRLSSFPLFHR